MNTGEDEHPNVTRLTETVSCTAHSVLTAHFVSGHLLPMAEAAKMDKAPTFILLLSIHRQSYGAGK
jgi:hypothetical protein